MARDHRGCASVACTTMALLLGCGAGVDATGKMPLRPASVWGVHLWETKARVVDGTQYRGPLFALRARAPSLTGAVWVRCPLEVPYRFESVEPQSIHIDMGDRESLVRFFPVTFRELLSHVEMGHHIRVDYEVTGRFVLDVPSPRAAAIVCPSASHHVKTVVVGAYRVLVGAEGSPGSMLVSPAGVRADTHGRPSTCRASKAGTPLEGCTVPLAFELVPIPGHAPAGKFRKDEMAGPESLPRAETMPGSTERRSGKSVTAGFDDCYVGFEPAGNAEADLKTLTARCGQPTGMVPHSEVLSGWQAATADESRYTVPFEAGACYRAFGVGGEGVRDLDMGWYDPAGRLIARDVRPDEWAVVSPSGLICAQMSGNHELVVSVERGQGSFAVQVWRVKR